MEINREKKNSNFDILIYINSKDNSDSIIPENKYISGSFNLENLGERNSQIYYIRKYNNGTKIGIEFSSNYKDIYIEFDNNTKFEKRINEFNQEYIIANTIDKFIVKINSTHITKKSIKSKQSLKDINYIFKYYYFNNFTSNKFSTGYSPENITVIPKILNFRENNIDYNLSVTDNNYELNSSNVKYSYYLSLYRNNNIIKNEELKTISFISSKKDYFYEFNSYNTTESFYFNLENIYNDDYIAILFIKIENLETSEEEYKMIKSTINKYEINKEKKNKYEINKEKKLNILSIIIVFIIFSVIAITIIAFIYKFHKIKKRNKDLEQQVRQISLCEKNDDDNFENDRATLI